MRRRPLLLLPVILALPLVLCALAAAIWGIPEARDWIRAAAKMAVIP